MYLDIMTYLEATIPNYPKRENLYSSYINVLRAHDCPGIHCDAPYFVEDNQTVIVYLNHHWDPEWGGETIFFDEDLDAVKLVHQDQDVWLYLMEFHTQVDHQRLSLLTIATS